MTKERGDIQEHRTLNGMIDHLNFIYSKKYSLVQIGEGNM